MARPIVGVFFLALVTAGCIGDGSDAEPAETSSAPAAATPPTTEPSSTGPPTTSAIAQAVVVERATLEGLPESGDVVAIGDAAAASTGPSIVVGRIENAATATGRPFALTSRNGRSWIRADLPLGAYASGEASAAGDRRDGVIAAGTVRAADGSSAIASWVRTGRRWTGPFATEPTGTMSVTATDIDAGPAGAVMLARAGGIGAIWLSADGRLWNAAPPEWSTARDAIAVAVGEAVVVLTQRPDQAGVVEPGVLVGQIGQDLEPINRPFGRPGRAVVNDVVAVGEGFLAVGGVRVRRGGVYEPAVWRSTDGLAWQRVRRAIPALDEPDGVDGTVIELVDAGAAGVVIASRSGLVWRSRDGRRFVEVPSVAIADDLVAVAATRAPVAVSSSALLAFAGGRWTTPARSLLPVSAVSTTLNGVTNVDGTWYAVGSRIRTRRRAGGVTFTGGVVWRSQDGRRWELLPGERALAGLELAAATGADGSLVAVGTGVDGAKVGAGQVLRSRNGRRWRAISSPLLVPPAGDLHRLESVAPGPAGAAVAVGYVDATEVRPLVLIVEPGRAIRRASRGLDVAAGDVVTLAGCASGGVSLVAGGGQRAALGWTSRNMRRWRRAALVPLARAEACAGGEDGRFVVAGTVITDQGPRAAALSGRPDRFVEIAIDDDAGRPNGVATRNDVVVIGGSMESDGAVWIGDDRRVERIDVADLTAPGSQTIGSVAIADDRAVIVGSALGQAAIWVVDLP